MKITSIEATAFLGARAVDLRLSKPVTLIAGKNGSGKSSLRDAIALALTADLGRVTLKKDAPSLISDCGETALVEVGFDGRTASVAITAAGKITDSLAGTELPASLPYVLDAQRFASLPEDDRRKFLFGLMGVKMDGATIKERLLARGCNAGKMERIIPILRTGFEPAAKEAASKARDAKAGWKAATGGETWGKEKAAKWQPAALPPDSEKASTRRDHAIAKYKEADQELAQAQQELGGAKAKIQEREKAMASRAALVEKAERIERITGKLAADREELATIEKTVADLRGRAGVSKINPKAPGEFLLRGLAAVTSDFLTLSCDFPDVAWPPELINRAATHLEEYRKLHGNPSPETAAEPDKEAIDALPRHEKALALMQSAVANGERDLLAAHDAAAKLKELDGAADEAIDLSALQAKVADITATRDGWKADGDKYGAIADQHARRKLLIDQVSGLHTDILEWTAIADALAPDGIQSELLAAALDPINERLTDSAGVAEWADVTITRDMEILAGGRPYKLLSESEKWRTDALIAEAVSRQSGLKLLVLDRFDVLDLKGREDLLYWLDGMAENGAIDTALIFGTLKALPAQLLPIVEGFWIENGTAGRMKESA